MPCFRAGVAPGVRAPLARPSAGETRATGPAPSTVRAEGTAPSTGAPTPALDALVEGFITGRHPKPPDAHEEIGCGAEHGRIGEPEPRSHDRVIFEGRKPARATVLSRGLHSQRMGFAGARGAVHRADAGLSGVAGITANEDEVVRPLGGLDRRVRKKLTAEHADVGRR